MRPALQRLLSRPSSLDLLQCLVEAPSLTNPTAYSRRKSPSLRRQQASFYSQSSEVKVRNAAPAATLDSNEARSKTPKSTIEEAHTSYTCEQNGKFHGDPSPDRSKNQNGSDKLPFSEAKRVPEPAVLDLRSIIDELKGVQLKATASGEPYKDKAHHESMKRLWGSLEYRLIRSDRKTAAEIWRYICSGGLELPVTGASPTGKGSLADNLWVPLLELGFKESETLKSICHYANELFDVSGKRWSKLYFYVVQHMLLNQRGSEAVYWHDILSRRHHPGPATFQRLMRNVIISKKGDLGALKEIYIRNSCRTTYSKVIPPLLESQEFYKAFDWHMFLQCHGDLPLNADIVEPLIQYFSIFDPNTAKGISSGLTISGSPLAPILAKRMNENTCSSHDVMKIVSGEAPRGMEKKLHNDKWGARWFATKWVTLDIAINTAHALKVNTIGPLSLQSIALREPRATDIARRINQLQQRGMSIGQSAYSKALVSFAKRGQDDLLQTLLESDQHPESFEDLTLQENLLIAHAQAGNWLQHQLVLAVQLASAIDPVMEEYNIQLRRYATRRDQTAIVKILEVMRMKRIAVEVVTIRVILRTILRPRTPGHRPDEFAPGYVKQDIDLAISILKNVMEYNSFVPAAAWQEVTRRLGMMGRINDLHSLYLWLVDRYGPDTNGHTRMLSISSKLLAQRPQLSTMHPLHPLRLLFPDVRQRSIVEWGFIRGLMSYAASVDVNPGLITMTTPEQHKAQALKQMTQGIRFLRELQKRGVYIKESSVRRAVYVRLVILYGPGKSSRLHNRAVRSYNPLTFNEAVRGVEEVWGNPLWRSIESLKGMIMKGRAGVTHLSPPQRGKEIITGSTGKVNMEIGEEI